MALQQEQGPDCFESQYSNSSSSRISPTFSEASITSISSSRPPSGSFSSETLYVNGSPISAATGEPILHLHHFEPYSIEVAFNSIDWGQQKSTVEKEEPVSPMSVPRNPTPYLWSCPNQRKRRSDEDAAQSDLVATPVPKKKQKCEQNSQATPQTRKLSLKNEEPKRQSFHSSRYRKRTGRGDSGAIDMDDLESRRNVPARRSLRLMSMRRREKMDEIDFELTP